MKKALSLILALVLCLSLCACGGKNDEKRTFELTDSSFRWDMTIDEAKDYMKKNSPVGFEAEIRDYDYWVIVTNDIYVFRFNYNIGDNDNIDMFKIAVNEDSGWLDKLVKQYGEYDEQNENMGSYIWYGTLSGRDTKMTLYPGYECYYIEFTPAK